MKIEEQNYIVIDWGTTNFRAFLVSHQNILLDSVSAEKGLMQIECDNFSEVLHTILSNWIGDFQHIPVLMAGMVGSAKGWKDVGYAQTPANLSDFVKKAYRFTLPWGAPGLITPGVAHHIRSKRSDVMRGEEVQTMGLSKIKECTDFIAILPGTHSKHVSFNNNKISQLSSFLTGEFYSILLNHSLLGTGLSDSETLDKEVFEQGVLEGQHGELTNKVFQTWSMRLFSQLSTENAADFLSGLLIGYELRNVQHQKIYLVGGDGLCSRYQIACNLLAIPSEVVSGDLCFLAGMIAIKKEVYNGQ